MAHGVDLWPACEAADAVGVSPVGRGVGAAEDVLPRDEAQLLCASAQEERAAHSQGFAPRSAKGQIVRRGSFDKEVSVATS